MSISKTITAFALMLSLGLCSCQKNEESNSKKDEASNKLTILIPRQLSTYATTLENGTNNENEVATLRIEMINSSGAAIWTHNYTKGTDYSVTNPGTVTNPNPGGTTYDADVINLSLEDVEIDILESTKEIRAYANIPNGDLPSTSSEPALLREVPQTEISAEIPLVNPTSTGKTIPMSGRLKNVDFSGGTYNATIELSRNIAKMRISVIKSATWSGVDIDYANIKIEALNVATKAPYYSWINNGSSETSGYDTKANLAAKNINYIDYSERAPHFQNATLPLSTTAITSLKGGAYVDSCYINPQNRTAADYAANSTLTAYKIKVPTKHTGGTTKTNEYIFPIKTNGTYDIIPNHIYTLQITIMGDGTEDVSTVIEVLPWNVEPEQQVGLMPFSLSAKSAVMDYAALGDTFTKTISARTYASPSDMTYAVVGGGTLPDWITGVTFSDGGSLGTVNLNITYKPTNAATHDDVKLTISDGSDSDVVTVVYDNGLIPRSAIDSIPHIASSVPTIFYDEWMAKPSVGIQSAKRGSNVLPTGIAEASDVLKYRDLNYSEAIGTKYMTNAAIGGMGIYNTDTLCMVSDLNANQAARYCRNLGSEWYLPNETELFVFATHLSMLGPSYTFVDDLLYPGSNPGKDGRCDMSNLAYSWNINPDFSIYTTNPFFVCIEDSGPESLSYARCLSNKN